ncbi:hypothetical protein CVT24_001043 [Panaeolus cyanescens]|uniref:LysM domain-containing protein n=1 Tax=Panaeolus cyanescens TaxID=181874 RepID=A0A409WPN1_9AGAR|nr:hypothetical protein CVT24_001043 [Panaeolus cyanescens]
MFVFNHLVTLAFVAVVSAGLTRRQLPPDCSRSYTVVAGDYCHKISQEQGVSTYQLMQVNDGIINSECTNLWVDQEICLGITGSDCTDVHTVVSGDTCSDLADLHEITVEDIIENNGKDEQCDLLVGEVLCVGIPA